MVIHFKKYGGGCSNAHGTVSALTEVSLLYYISLFAKIPTILSVILYKYVFFKASKLSASELVFFARSVL